MYQHVTQNAPSGNHRDGLWQRRVRSGRLARQQRRFPGPSPHHPLLLIASRSVETDSPGAKAPGLFVGSIQTICDVGGGHGRLICALLKAQPHLTGLVLDLPEVFNDRSKLWATKLGLENRCTYVVGDMFKQVPGIVARWARRRRRLPALIEQRPVGRPEQLGNLLPRRRQQILKPSESAPSFARPPPR